MKVIVNSLPKSGTHLVVQLMKLIGLNDSRSHFSGGLTRPFYRNPFKNMRIKKEITHHENEGYRFDLDQEVYLKTEASHSLMKRINNGSYTPAHVPFSHKLHSLFNENSFKMIFIVRDPRAVVASEYLYYMRDKTTDGHKKILEMSNSHERMLAILNGFTGRKGSPIAPLKNRIRDSLDWFKSDLENVYPVTFEDLIGSKGGGSDEKQMEKITSILEFLGLDTDPAYIAENIFSTKSKTFRKGSIDSWKEHLDQEVLFEQCPELQSYVEELGYKI